MRYTVETRARANYDLAMSDVSRLLTLHDAETKRRPGRPSSYIEVFKRAGVVIAVTAWEGFIEDTVTDECERRLKAAERPQDVLAAFHSVAHAWLQQPRRPPDLAAWTSDGWKAVVWEHVLQEVNNLHTPDGQAVARITRRFLGRDLTTDWKWAGMRPQAARTKLDALIQLRGRLAHRSRDIFAESRAASVKREQLAGAVEFLNRLVQRTEEALGRQPSYHGEDSVHE